MAESFDDVSENGAVSPAPPTSTSTGVPNRAPTTAQVLLGMLVVGQLLFLLLANSLNMLSSMRRVTGHNEEVGQVIDHVSGGLTSSKGHWFGFYRMVNHWEEIFFTGQNWRLFSPFVADWCCLVSVELRWDDREQGAQ